MGTFFKNFENGVKILLGLKEYKKCPLAVKPYHWNINENIADQCWTVLVTDGSL